MQASAVLGDSNMYNTNTIAINSNNNNSNKYVYIYRVDHVDYLLGGPPVAGDRAGKVRRREALRGMET